MRNERKHLNTRSRRQAVADDAARKLDALCPKCGSQDVKCIEPFNPIHADGVYCNQCGRHSFPDETQ
jgi:hypothetical protein